MIRNTLLSGLVGLGLLASPAASGAPAGLPDYYPDDYQQIVDAAKSEGKVLIYSNIHVDVWPGYIGAIHELYPWLEIEYVELGAGAPIERYLTESGTGTPSADLIITSSPDGWTVLVNKGEILDYASPEAPYFPDWSKPQPGLYAITGDPSLMFWNKALLPEDMVPTGYVDLMEKAKAHPEVFDGKLSTFAYHLSSTGYSTGWAFANHIGADRAWAIYDTLGPLTRPERSVGTSFEKVVSGEYTLAWLVSPNALWASLKSDPNMSDVLGWRFASDATTMIPLSIGVTKHAAHPDAAKLVLDFFMSRKGQIALGMSQRTPLRSDVTSEDIGGFFTMPKITEQVGEENLAIVPYDDELLEDYDAFIARWKQSFGL